MVASGEESQVSLISFLSKQFIGVIEWNEPQDGILAYRYPMQDYEIQNGGQLTVSCLLYTSLPAPHRATPGASLP